MGSQPGTASSSPGSGGRGGSSIYTGWWPGDWGEQDGKGQPGSKRGIAGRGGGLTASGKQGAKTEGAVISLTKETGNYTNWWKSGHK